MLYHSNGDQFFSTGQAYVLFGMALNELFLENNTIFCSKLIVLKSQRILLSHGRTWRTSEDDQDSAAVRSAFAVNVRLQGEVWIQTFRTKSFQT